MLAVGFTAARTTSSLPLVMPPAMPPAWLVAVRPSASAIGSLWAEPRRAAAANPSPNSTPFDRGDGEEQVCRRAFDRVEKGFAPAGGDARYAAFDDAAHGVFVAQGVVDRGVEPRRIGLAADGGQPRGEGRTAEYFFRYDARGYECQRQSAREVAAAPRVVPPFELDGRRAVGVRRTRLREQVVVVARTGVGVFEDERQRCARGVSLVESLTRSAAGRFPGAGVVPLAPLRRRARSASKSGMSSGSPAGTPSSVTPTCGPWDSPARVMRKRVPKLFIGMDRLRLLHAILHRRTSKPCQPGGPCPKPPLRQGFAGGSNL